MFKKLPFFLIGALASFGAATFAVGQGAGVSLLPTVGADDIVTIAPSGGSPLNTGATASVLADYIDGALGNSVITGTLSVSGVTTPTGGVAQAGTSSNFIANMPWTCNVPITASGDGTDATPATTETYYAPITVTGNVTTTGVTVFNGSATGSGNITAYLADSAGTQLAHTASTAISGTDAMQSVPWTATAALKGPGVYWIMTQYDNTSTRFNTVIYGTCYAGKQTSTTYGTFPTVTLPTSFTTGLGPMATLY